MMKKTPAPRITAARLRTALSLLIVVVGGLVALSARAELALLTNGDFLKVERVKLLEDERMRLDLEGGGTLFLPVDRVARVVDDEIVPESAEPLPEVAPVGVLPLRWHEGATLPDSPFGALFFDAGKRHDLNPLLLSAMARAESAYDPAALSYKGARGLLQLMPATAERFGVRRGDLYDPKRNIEAAARYLNFLIEEFDGELDLVLAAYNAGEGNVRKYNGVPRFRETQNYIRRIYGFLGLES